MMRSLIPIMSYSPHGIFFKSSQIPLAPEAMISLLGNVKNDQIPSGRRQVFGGAGFVLYPDFNKIGGLDITRYCHVLKINPRTDVDDISQSHPQDGYNLGFPYAIIYRSNIIGKRLKYQSFQLTVAGHGHAVIP